MKGMENKAGTYEKKTHMLVEEQINVSSRLLKKPASMSEKENQKNWDGRYMPVRLPSGAR